MRATNRGVERTGHYKEGSREPPRPRLPRYGVVTGSPVATATTHEEEPMIHRRAIFVVLPFAVGGCCAFGGDECTPADPPRPPAADLTGRWRMPFAFCSVADLTMQRNVITGTCRSATTPPRMFNVFGDINGEAVNVGILLVGDPTYEREQCGGSVGFGDKNRIPGSVVLIGRASGNAPVDRTPGEMVRVQ